MYLNILTGLNLFVVFLTFVFTFIDFFYHSCIVWNMYLRTYVPVYVSMYVYTYAHILYPSI